MQTSTVALVLVAALAHALWNLASKYKRGNTLLFVCVYTCASAMLYVPIGLFFPVARHDALDWRLAAAAAVSALLHNAYSLILQAGYDRAEPGVVYPIARGTGPVMKRARPSRGLIDLMQRASICRWTGREFQP